MSSAEEKIRECVVCCHRYGGFLMESVSTISYIVCPECGAHLVVREKKDNVYVFDDNRSEEELTVRLHLEGKSALELLRQVQIHEG